MDEASDEAWSERGLQGPDQFSPLLVDFIRIRIIFPVERPRLVEDEVMLRELRARAPDRRRTVSGFKLLMASVPPSLSEPVNRFPVDVVESVTQLRSPKETTASGSLEIGVPCGKGEARREHERVGPRNVSNITFVEVPFEYDVALQQSVFGKDVGGIAEIDGDRGLLIGGLERQEGGLARPCIDSSSISAGGHVDLAPMKWGARADA
jgi:hypothetical protein